MALFLSLLTYGSHISNSGIMLNKNANSILVNEAPGGMSDFITDSYEEDGFVIFTIALPASGVEGFNPDTDVTVANGTIDHHDFYDWGEGTVYYEFSMNNNPPGAVGEAFEITMSVSADSFLVNGVGNQAASFEHFVDGTEPVPEPDNTPPSISITSPSIGAEFIVGDNVTFSASASDNDGDVVRVDFHVGNSVITDTSAPYSISWPSEEGTHSLFAIATDNDGASFQTAAFNIIVAEPDNTPPSISITSPSIGAEFIVGDNVTFSASASDNDGDVVRVDFHVGNSVITDTSAPYSISWPSEEGTHSLFAIATDNDGASFQTAAFNIEVVEGGSSGGNSGGITDFIVDSYEEDGFVIFTIALPAAGVTGFNPDTDIAVVNGIIDHHDFYDWGEDTVYYEFSMNSSSSNVSNITMSVSENAFFVNGVGNQAASLVHSVEDAPPVSAPPAVSLVSPSNGAEFTEGEVVTMTATASDSNGIQSVSFIIGNNLEFTDTTPPYSFNWTATLLDGDISTIRVIAIDNEGEVTIAPDVSIVIEEFDPPIVVPGGDRAALMAIYNATGGPNWSNNDNWGTTAAIGTWHGVTVNDAGQVTVLNLSSNNLTGAIPDEISNLQNLRNIYFRLNELTSIPSTIGDLPNLINLSLTGNQLTSIPSTIGNLEDLTGLYLGDNQLTSIPSIVGSLTNLVELFLTGNQLTSLPSTIGNFGKLEFFDIDNNQLTALPSTIVNLNEIKRINFSNNKLTFSDLETNFDFLNSSAFNFSQQNVDVVNSQSVNGGASITLSNPLTSANNNYQWFKDGIALGVTTKNLVISNATVANAGVYHFTATNSIVVNLTLTSESIALTVNERETSNDREALMAIYNATGGPNWINNSGWGTNESIETWHGVGTNGVGEFVSLNLNSNNLVGEIPSEIGDLVSLTRLFLSDNNITSLPESVGNLVNLSEVNLSGNELDSVPDGIFNPFYFSLDLSDNNLTSSSVNLSEFSGRVLLVGSNNLESLPAIFNIRTTFLRLGLQNNNLQFNDLELISSVLENMTNEYTPQQNIDVVNSRSVNEGESITLNNPLTSTNNSYQWFKDGVALGVTTKNLVINNATAANAGVYHFTATNSIITGLTLTRESITLTVNGGSVTPPPVTLPGLGGENQNMAVNIYTNEDYSVEKPWTDVMRSHRSWSTTGDHDNGGDAPRDINGWPTTDATCLLYAGIETGDNAGTYKLSFETNNTAGVSVTAEGSGISVTGKSVSGNRVSYNVVVSDPNNEIMYLSFSNTSGGVRNAKLMRPIEAGSNVSYPESQVFTDQFLALIAPFSTIRYMDWTSTNSNDDDIWAERTKWTDASQALPPVIPGKDYTDDQGRGSSWESVIMMSNISGKDAWITIPHKVDDNYIRNLAQLFRDGNEFTPGLNSNLKLYVEYSNEVWNGIFDQTEEIEGIAIDKVTSNPNSDINFDNLLGEIPNFDGTIDPNDINDEEYLVVEMLTMREKGVRLVEISETFREVFGDSQMMSRIRPVLTLFRGQNGMNNPIVSFLDNYYNKRDSRSDVAVAHPVNYYIWGAGGSTYWYTVTEADGDKEGGLVPSDFPTIGQIWDSGEYNNAEYYNALKNDMILARSYGLEYVSYEGNTHLSEIYDQETFDLVASDEAIIIASNAMPEMKDEFKEHHQVFESLGGQLNAFFQTTGDFGFDLTTSNTNYTTPKYQAIYEMTNEVPQPVTYENVAPFSMSGGQFDFIPSYTDPSTGSLTLSSNNTDIEESAGNVAGYIFSVPNSGTFQLSVSYSGNGSSGLAIEFDGNVVGTIANASAAGTFTQTITCSINRLHSIRVVAVGATLNGTVSINTIAVGPVTAQNVVSNQFQNLLIPTQVSLIKESSNLMFPNPANIGDNVSIRDIEARTVHVEILNMRNILIKEETVPVRNNSYTFNTSNLSSGIYIVKITNTENNKTITKRMVIGSGK